MKIPALPLEVFSKWGIVKLSLILFTSAIIYLFLSSSSIFAQNNTIQNTYVGEPGVNQPVNYDSNLDDNVPRDQGTFVQSVIIELFAAATCQISGSDPIRQDRNCLGMNPETGKIGFVEDGGGILGLVTELTVLTFTPPTSSKQYFNYLASNFGITEKAYAQDASSCTKNGRDRQGIGFCGIAPLIPIWVAMRNIVYLLFVVMFAVIGMAIMLRLKIDPRTVMTIQNQIPKIIIGIVMVTFSFAIAGFLIDIMYVSIYVVGRVLIGINDVDISNFGLIATGGTPFDGLDKLFDDGLFGIVEEGKNAIEALEEDILGITDTGDDLADFINDPIKSLVSIGIGFIAAFVIFIGLLFIVFRIFIELLKAYIGILLNVVFAPFWFLIGLMPGSSLGVGAWFRDIVANLAVFPTVIAMFLLAKIFFDLAEPIGATGALFTPPFIGGIGGDNGGEIFAGIVALGFLFLTPNVLKMTKAALKAPNSGFGSVLQPAAIGGKLLTGGTRASAEHYAHPRFAKEARTGESPGFIAKGLAATRIVSRTH